MHWTMIVSMVLLLLRTLKEDNGLLWIVTFRKEGSFSHYTVNVVCWVLYYYDKNNNIANIIILYYHNYQYEKWIKCFWSRYHILHKYWTIEYFETDTVPQKRNGKWDNMLQSIALMSYCRGPKVFYKCLNTFPILGTQTKYPWTKINQKYMIIWASSWCHVCLFINRTINCFIFY